MTADRIGNELEKILKGPNIAQALKNLQDANVLPLLYKIPTEIVSIDDQSQKVNESLTDCIQSISLITDSPSDFQLKLMYALLMMPFQNFQMPMGKKVLPAPEVILLENLKRSINIKTAVSEIHKGLSDYANILNKNDRL